MQRSPFAMPTGRSQHFANAYRQVGVETGVAGATPHRLVQMLFDGFIDALAQARGAMRAGQIEQKGRAIHEGVVKEIAAFLADFRAWPELPPIRA